MGVTGDVARFREFSRFFTAHVGLLIDRPYDERFTLAQTRVLYELAQGDLLQPSAIARELGLDLGYLSRILSRFQKLKLIARSVDPGDARKTSIRLTEKGRAAFAEVDRASRERVAALLRPLSAQARRDVLAAAGAIRAAFADTPSNQAANLRPLAPGDIGWITHRQAILYHEEYGWDQSYEALIAEIMAAFVRTFDASKEQAWVAECNGEIVGSIFLVKGDVEGTAKLRLLYVEPSARGLGLGRRLVDVCVLAAQSFGYERLTLWTNDVLASARRIYEAAGFALVSEERHHSFGKDLVGQTWTLEL